MGVAVAAVTGGDQNGDGVVKGQVELCVDVPAGGSNTSVVLLC